MLPKRVSKEIVGRGTSFDPSSKVPLTAVYASSIAPIAPGHRAGRRPVATSDATCQVHKLLATKRRQAVIETFTYVGMDVRKDSISVATAQARALRHGSWA